MSLVTLYLPFLYPEGTAGVLSDGGATIGNKDTLDAAGEYTAWVGVAEQAMTITHFGFMCGSPTGSPTADLRIETVDASGNPSGTLWAANTNIVTGTLASGWNLAALTASASLVRGDKFAAKITYSSGTSFVTRTLSATVLRANIPYFVTNVTGSPVKSGNTTPLSAALGSSATTFYSIRQMEPYTTVTNGTFSNSTAGAKRGLRFKVPFKCRVGGAAWFNGSAVGDLNIIMMDDSGAEMSSSSTAYDGDLSGGSTGGSLFMAFDNAVILNAGTWYRLVLEPTSATNCAIPTYTMPSANYIGATPWGANAHLTTFTTAGGWIDTATDQLVRAQLLIDQFDDGAGAGGGGAHTFA